MLFGYKCFILNNGKDTLKKFDAKDDVRIFIKYSTSSKTFRGFNKRTMITKEFVHVTFDKTNPKLVEVEVLIVHIF